ncbi:MAG: HDOD domain-containing protein [Nitrospirae bacterium]|nr:HDOD domain-containing protein [Nitrospirota bacterium]
MINPKLVESILANIDELPPMPASIAALLEMFQEEDSLSAAKIEKIISSDQSLTMNVLKLCNSAFFGLRQEVSSIKQAASLIGFKALKALALGSFVQHITEQRLEGYLIEKGGLWEHSISVAGGSRLIAERYLKGFEDTAFTAGIVHDVGKIIMSKYLQKEFTEIVSVIKKDAIPFHEAEKRICGITHAEIGQMAAERWKLPNILIDVIRNHHSPQNAIINKQLVSIVHISDSVSKILGTTDGLDSVNMNIDEGAVSSLNIDKAEYEDLIKRLTNLMLFPEQR